MVIRLFPGVLFGNVLVIDVVVERRGIEERGEPADYLHAVLLKERHHVSYRTESVIIGSFVTAARAPLGHVPDEIVVANLPGRIEDEHRDGNAAGQMFRDRVAN